MPLDWSFLKTVRFNAFCFLLLSNTCIASLSKKKKRVTKCLKEWQCACAIVCNCGYVSTPKDFQHEGVFILTVMAAKNVYQPLNRYLTFLLLSFRLLILAYLDLSALMVTTNFCNLNNWLWRRSTYLSQAHIFFDLVYLAQ